MVYNVKKLYKETGGFEKYVKGDRQKITHTETVIETMRRDIIKDMRVQVRKLAKAHNMAPLSMSKLVMMDLNLVLNAMNLSQTLTTAQREKSLERAKKLLTWMKSNSGRVVVFSDEKNFYVDAMMN